MSGRPFVACALSLLLVGLYLLLARMVLHLLHSITKDSQKGQIIKGPAYTKR